MRCNTIDDDTYKTRPMIPEQLLAFELKATSRSRCESSRLQQHYYLPPPMAFSPTCITSGLSEYRDPTPTLFRAITLRISQHLRTDLFTFLGLCFGLFTKQRRFDWDGTMMASLATMSWKRIYRCYFCAFSFRPTALRFV